MACLFFFFSPHCKFSPVSVLSPPIIGLPTLSPALKLNLPKKRTGDGCRGVLKDLALSTSQCGDGKRLRMSSVSNVVVLGGMEAVWFNFL